MLNNSVILLKTILVISVSSMTFFVVGFGLGTESSGGILGQDHFFGTNYCSEDYTKFIYFFSLCVKMSVIATGSISERVEIDKYIFFSFVTSGFIFPIGLAWCWNDGWLQGLGFIDYGGVAIVHVMGGLAGFIGTYIIGPRIGLFKSEKELDYILDEENFILEENDRDNLPHQDDDDKKAGMDAMKNKKQKPKPFKINNLNIDYYIKNHIKNFNE